MSDRPSSPASLREAFEAEQPKRQCRCNPPVRNEHLKPVGDYPRCARCLLPMLGDQVRRAVPAGSRFSKGKHGSSGHRQARVEKFVAAQRKKAEKRKRAKRNRR